MKELSIEEKARRYNEAIERAKNTIEVNQTIPDIVECVESLFPELAESEDERIRKDIVEAVELHKDFTQGRKERIYAWLEKQKSEEINVKALLTADKLAAAEMTGRLKERKDIVENPQKYGLEKQGEQKPAWSEEDEARFESCIKILQASDGYDTINTKWLKSLRGRVQPKQKWSEEEEQNLNEALSYIKDDALKEFIKSLRPQTRWRPSDEQMDALWDSIKHNLHLHPVLKSLYNDLKKLREK